VYEAVRFVNEGAWSSCLGFAIHRIRPKTLKYSGISVTLGSCAAATTFRVVAVGAGVVCAAAETASTVAPSITAVAVNRMMTSIERSLYLLRYAEIASDDPPTVVST
jgi:hypothetical protein